MCIWLRAFHRAPRAFTHHLLKRATATGAFAEVNPMPGNDAADREPESACNRFAHRAGRTRRRKHRTENYRSKEALHPEFDGHAGILGGNGAPGNRHRLPFLTVTEKGYCTDPPALAEVTNPLIQNDLAHPQQPKSAIGYIVEALNMRREQGLKATVLSCDNVRENGHKPWLPSSVWQSSRCRLLSPHGLPTM
ncbi:hypothetical protein KCP76_05650 [Salmonella enterica subsp. enterica serovar Weltevreden]|nr:hypothetical protein KCP76_05650 [Salmonella enterica subsp. enterica serovar Weltevreden]